MKGSTTIVVEQKTRSMMKTLAQVSGVAPSDVWQKAAEMHLQKFYASTLRKAAKEVNSALENAVKKGSILQ